MGSRELRTNRPTEPPADVPAMEALVEVDWFSITDGEWPAVRRAQEKWRDPANFDEDGRQRSSLSDVVGAL